MFSVKTAMMSVALATSGMAMVAPAIAHAGVVVKSSGPSAGKFPVGKKIDDKGRITLKSGDSVTILSNGGTRVISGAGTHRVSSRATSKRTSFSALTRNRSSGQVRTGASRGDEGAMPTSMTSPNLWYVDVSKSGKMCVADMSAVQMWRPGRDQASTYVIASSASAEHVHATFPEGDMITKWDATRLPLADGVSYTITGPGGSDASSVTFVQMDTVPEDIEGMTLALLEKGCMTQVEVLTTTLK